MTMFVSCSNLTSSGNSGNNDKLPENPKNIQIRWSEDGGMLPEYKRIYLSNDSCSYLSSKNQVDQLVEFSLPLQDLKSLYQIFYDNKFNEIKTYEEEIYDRGGSTISLTADTQSYSISNSGMTLIDKNYISNYQTIEEAVLNVAHTEVNKQNRTVIVDLDTTITNSTNNVILYVNGNTEYSEEKNGEFFTLELDLLPMNNKFEIYFMKDGNNPYQTVSDRYELLVDELPADSKIILTLEGKQLNIK